jgi:uroporphyrinogen III methyltransferase/synthase
MTRSSLGKVFLVGAGPGDAGLLTLKGKRCLEAAQAVLYDELANRALLEFAPGDAELIYVGKKIGAHCADQREIETLLIHRARQGKCVVRLKGGDPLVFGRGGEEALALRQAGVPFEIVPGVSSAIAVPAYAGIPLTHRSVASSFAVVSGHRVLGGATNWGALARSVDTLVILMGLHNLTGIMKALLAGGCEAERPVALIQAGTKKQQRVLSGTVLTIGAIAAAASFRSPALIVVGRAVQLRNALDWFDADLGETGLLKELGEGEAAELT